ncbi:hypothetical protein ZHAS_00002500 [Anopheles sinensis]|uniref:Uncharacterized protein n=1 Tax=Anopheles sinensis TaxID=74873 RepID=A0A084VCD4_ANOSI|nr:hypothetical protein ZHAS_00002500 [Anopheles sinensis]
MVRWLMAEPCSFSYEVDKQSTQEASFLCYKELRPDRSQQLGSAPRSSNGVQVLEETTTDSYEKTYRSICLIQTCEVANGGTNRIVFRKA